MSLNHKMSIYCSGVSTIQNIVMTNSFVYTMVRHVINNESCIQIE